MWDTAAHLQTACDLFGRWFSLSLVLGERENDDQEISPQSNVALGVVRSARVLWIVVTRICSALSVAKFEALRLTNPEQAKRVES